MTAVDRDDATAPSEPPPELADGIIRRGMHLLVEILRTNPWPSAGAIAGAFVFASASVAGAVILGRVTDDLIIRAADQAIEVRAAVVAGIVIVAMSVIRAAGVVARRYFGIMASRGMQRHWYNRLSDQYLDQPLPFFATQPTGKLLAHAEGDAERAAFAMQPLPLSLGAVVLLVFASINLAVLDPLLLAIGLTLFPALIVMNQVYVNKVTAPSARAQAELGVVSSVAHESFEGALVVKLLGLDRHEGDRMRVAADRLRHERLIIGRLRAAFEPGLDALPALGTVALLAVGAWRVSEGSITTGDMVQAMALFGILAFPMRVVGFLLQDLPRSVVSRDRIVGVLDADFRDRAPLGAGGAEREPLPSGPLSVSVHDVHFDYGVTNDDGTIEAVLHHLDLRVEPGQVVALVGSTGSGKSTLCHLLAGLATPSTGEVRIGDVPLPRARPADVTAAVSLVFQESFLFADTVLENLTLGTDVSEARIADALSIAQAGYVEDLPLGRLTVLGERGVSLSGGQRQRLALARALLRRPRLLLLDDATSAIDPVVEAKILDALRAELDTTTVVVAHRVATIRLADRVVHLDGGHIVGDGTHDELLARSEAYAALVRAYEQAEDGLT